MDFQSKIEESNSCLTQFLVKIPLINPLETSAIQLYKGTLNAKINIFINTLGGRTFPVQIGRFEKVEILNYAI